MGTSHFLNKKLESLLKFFDKNFFQKKKNSEKFLKARVG